MSDTHILRAAELALGLSTGIERIESERLRAADSEFAAEVALWESIAESWLAELPDQPVSAPFWDRVAALIAPQDRSTVASVAAIRPAVIAPGSGVWRPLAMAASLLACVFAGLWLAQLGGSPKPQAGADGRFSIAQISGTGDPHLATVLYDRSSGTLTIRIAAIATAPAKVSDAPKAPEIWLINGAGPPHSLGFGNAGAATRMQASAPVQRSLVDGATLAITLEPVSPQPHTAPSSKILGTGTISSI